jgi:chemotaxis protein methyltransferase CheR
MLRSEDQFFVQQLLSKHAGVALADAQSHLVDSRLASLARAQNLKDAAALVQALRKSPSGALLESVIEALTTHETSFFRDHQPFSALTEQVLPELIRRRARHRMLSIWSAACSTGQEPYSVAMLLQEHFPQLRDWRVRIWATDVSKTVVERARQGLFSERELQRGVSRAAQAKYFEKHADRWQIRDAVRRMVSWETLNLTSTWPPMAPFDLVLLRNVLIYFPSDTRAGILQRAASTLAHDGYLLLGTSETTFGACDALESVLVGGATLYRRVGA